MTASNRFRLFAGAGSALAIAVLAAGLFLGMRASEAQTPATPGAPAPLTVAPGAPAAEPGGGIVATIDGEPITERDLDIAYDEFTQQLSSFGLDRRRDVAIDLLIHIRLLAKEAAKLGIDKEPEMADRLRLVHDRALYGELLNRLFATSVTEDAAHKLFDEQQAKAGVAVRVPRAPHSRADGGRGEGHHRQARQWRRLRATRQGRFDRRGLGARRG